MVRPLLPGTHVQACGSSPTRFTAHWTCNQRGGRSLEMGPFKLASACEHTEPNHCASLGREVWLECIGDIVFSNNGHRKHLDKRKKKAKQRLVLLSDKGRVLECSRGD